VLKQQLDNNGEVTLLDYGGSLGTIYYQSQYFLPDLSKTYWNIVEQPKFVDYGETHLQNDNLKFFSSIEEAIIEREPNVVLLSGVLPFIPNPYDVLASIVAKKFPYIIVDRTPFSNIDKQLLTVLHVPLKSGKTSYPMWIFTFQELINVMAKTYNLIATYNAIDGVQGWGKYKASFKGLVFECRSS
jgi:putative methyltransferase (TIGR04325 family)